MSDVTVSDYHEIEKILRRSDFRQALYDEGAILMAKVLVNLDGEEHRVRRNTEAQVFRRDYFRYYEEKVFPETLAQTLDPFVARGKGDLVDIGYRILLNLTTEFAGIDRPQKSPEETATLLQMLRTFGQAATLGQSTGDRAAIRADIQRGLDRFDAEFFTPSMRRRQALLATVQEGTLAADDLPRDVLTVLLQNAETVPAHDVLMKEMAFFLLAGAFTSVHATTHAMHEILTWRDAHPQMADRLMHDPLLIQRCIHETIRLHPSSPVACRRPKAPSELPNGVIVNPEDRVTLDLVGANKDAALFGSDAAVYNPLREGGTSPYGLSFGFGAHACIGRNLAAGVVPDGATDPANHHFGTVALIARHLLQHGVRADPDAEPRMDATTTRPNWAYYPIVFG